MIRISNFEAREIGRLRRGWSGEVKDFLDHGELNVPESERQVWDKVN